MPRGDKRKEIMDLCPEEFEDDLKAFIDEIETNFSDIVNLLSTVDINSLDKITEAHNLADEVGDSLY